MELLACVRAEFMDFRWSWGFFGIVRLVWSAVLLIRVVKISSLN